MPETSCCLIWVSLKFGFNKCDPLLGNAIFAGCIFIVEGVRLPAVLALQGGHASSDAGLQGPAGAKGAKKGGHAVTSQLKANRRAFTLNLH